LCSPPPPPSPFSIGRTLLRFSLSPFPIPFPSCCVVLDQCDFDFPPDFRAARYRHEEPLSSPFGRNLSASFGPVFFLSRKTIVDLFSYDRVMGLGRGHSLFFSSPCFPLSVMPSPPFLQQVQWQPPTLPTLVHPTDNTPPPPSL